MRTRHVRRSLAVLAAAAGLAALAGGCGNAASSTGNAMGGQSPGAQAVPAAGATSTPVQAATVDIRSFKFKPVTVTVQKGGRVRFVNSDNAAHTATADDRSFDTQTINLGKTRMVTFTGAGTVRYHCDFHPFMKGTIVVK